MSKVKAISILIVVVGLLLPVVSLGFVSGHDPRGSFVWNLTLMEIVLTEEWRDYSDNVLIANLENTPKELISRVSIPYKYVLAFGCLMICGGVAGILFSPRS